MTPTSDHSHPLNKSTNYQMMAEMSPSSNKEPLRARDLLGQSPFEPFPDFQVSELPSVPDDWIERKFQDGKPFIIRGFNSLPAWADNSELLKTEKLADLVTSKNKPLTHPYRSPTDL